VLRLANIIDGAIDESDVRDIRLIDKEIAKYVLQPGDLLCVRVNGSRNLVGRVVPFIAQRRWAYCDHFIRLRPDQTSVDSRYLAHYLNTRVARRQIELNMVSSAGQNTVSQGTMLDLSVPLPDLATQRAIVAELEKQFSRLDEAVANLKRVKANLKRYKAAVLKAAVEGRLVPTEAEMAAHDGRGYETGSQLVARFLQERRRAWNGKRPYQDPEQPDARGLPPLPEGWAWTRLDTVAALKGGITVDKKRRDPTARPVPYLRVANVQRGYLDLEEVKEIEAPQADIEELRLQPGDILFNEGGDRDKLGRGWIWEGQLAECIHQNHVFRARPYSADVAGKLISWWGNTYGKDYFLREGKQTTNLASINMRKLSAFPVPIPPRLEQHRIVAEVDRRLSLAREVEVQVHANLARVQTSRHAMLVRAFGASMEPQQANVFMQVD